MQLSVTVAFSHEKVIKWHLTITVRFDPEPQWPTVSRSVVMTIHYPSSPGPQLKTSHLLQILQLSSSSCLFPRDVSNFHPDCAGRLLQPTSTGNSHPLSLQCWTRFGTWWQFAQDDLLGLLSFLPVPPMCLLPICIQILCWHLQLNPIKVNLGRIPTTCGDIPLLAYNSKKLKCSVRLPIILIIIYHITAVPVSINDIFFWHSSLKLNILCLRIYCNNL